MEAIDLYLVRIWRGVTRFRASARRVTDDESQVFASPQDMARYFAASQRAPLAGPGGAAASAPPPAEEEPPACSGSAKAPS